MNKCFAYQEETRNGIKYMGCECLKRQAFIRVHRMGGCSMKNCPFYKESRDQIRSDWGLYPMNRYQKEDQAMFFKRNYEGLHNVMKW